jgi:adenylate kinase
MNLILLGPPGAGKGTQAQRLAASFDLTHLASGDVLRAERASGTDLGKRVAGYMDAGELVPDEIITEVMISRLRRIGDSAGFLLDGFPRTVPQAESLDGALAASKRRLGGVIDISVPDQELIRRTSGRRTCPKCHAVYHVESKPPRREGVCDSDGEALVHRFDDKPEVVRQRLVAYREQTRPVTDYYRRAGLLHEVSGSGSVEEVYSALHGLVAGLCGDK